MKKKEKIHIIEIVNQNQNNQLFRSEDEICQKLAEYEDKIWYNRHLALREKVEQGQELVNANIWQDALYSAQLLRERYGKENLLPKSYFELGIWYGWLSELRWMLGDSENYFDT